VIFGLGLLDQPTPLFTSWAQVAIFGGLLVMMAKWLLPWVVKSWNRKINHREPSRVSVVTSDQVEAARAANAAAVAVAFLEHTAKMTERFADMQREFSRELAATRHDLRNLLTASQLETAEAVADVTTLIQGRGERFERINGQLEQVLRLLSERAP